MGLAISFLLVYIGRFKVFMDSRKKSGSFWVKVIDLLWKVLLPLLFGLFALIMPTKILCFFIVDENTVKALSSLYLYSFILSFFICVFLLIRFRKIKIKNTLE